MMRYFSAAHSAGAFVQNRQTYGYFSEINTFAEAIKDVTDYAGSPFVVSGGEITDGTNAGTFKVAALTALLRKTDSDIGELDYVSKLLEDNIAITSADTIYYVILNYNSGTPTVSIATSPPNLTTNIPIGFVMKDTSNNIYHIDCGFRFQQGALKAHRRAKELRASGANKR